MVKIILFLSSTFLRFNLADVLMSSLFSYLMLSIDKAKFPPVEILLYPLITLNMKIMMTSVHLQD